MRQELADRPAVSRDGKKFAAVAIVLLERKNEPSVLLIERATKAHDPWSGHLAFPGGRRDPSDLSLRATAERETLEELGLDLSKDAELLGPLDHLMGRGGSAGSGLVIAPFVFALHSEPIMQPNPEEVQRCFWTPVEPLLRGEHDTTIDVQHAGRSAVLPAYRVEDGVLWGLSYQMLTSLFALLNR